MDISGLKISDYTYQLPEDCIAQRPLKDRDRSRLLVVEGESISEDFFLNIADHLPTKALLVRNITRVIQARLVFKKESGARIEVFCLEPVRPFTEMNQALQSGPGCEWKCLIGNARKWRQGKLSLELPFRDEPVLLTAEKAEDLDGQFVVRFTWADASISWASILDAAGKIPLPPYITREADAEDQQRYQTVFAHEPGSVAAPTAGLHFSDAVFRSLSAKGIRSTNVTLHVGAGTFKPVETEFVSKHRMHHESFLVHRSALESLLDSSTGIVTVGTTTLRTLESIYWLGVMMNDATDLSRPIHLGQWEPYGANAATSLGWKTIIEKLLIRMQDQGVETLRADTQLMIVPGYRIRTTDILITNFHQPGSTLLMLVAAFAGSIWKTAYDYALDHSFRFLSYGDACLFKNPHSIRS